MGPNSGLSKLVQSITFKENYCIGFFQIMPQLSTKVPQGHHMGAAQRVNSLRDSLQNFITLHRARSLYL